MILKSFATNKTEMLGFDLLSLTFRLSHPIRYRASFVYRFIFAYRFIEAGPVRAAPGPDSRARAGCRLIHETGVGCFASMMV